MVKYIVIHCSATPADFDITAADIDKMHKSRGWRKIGYHFVIARDGVLETGRSLNETGAHVKGYNRDSLGICLAGGTDDEGVPENNFTDPQWITLKSITDTLKTIHPEAEVLGHRDLSPDLDGDGIIEEWEWLKACPCFDVKTWYNSEEP